MGVTHDVEIYTKLDPIGVETCFPSGTPGFFQAPLYPLRIGSERKHNVVSVTRCRSDHPRACRNYLNRHLFVFGSQPDQARIGQTSCVLARRPGMGVMVSPRWDPRRDGTRAGAAASCREELGSDREEDRSPPGGRLLVRA